MYTDPIADLLTRIRNAYKARKDALTIPFSKMKEAILKVLKERNFVENYSTIKNGKFDELEIELKEDIKTLTLKKISKPGQRIYIKSANISKINGGLGLAIYSTSKGVMSGENAKKQKLGGELICEIF